MSARAEVHGPAPVSSPEPLPRLLRAAPAGLVGVFVVLGVTSAMVVPWDVADTAIRERTPPDEAAHFAYIEHLATARSLPVFESADENYEAHQPPLYYIIGLIPYAAVAWAGPRAAYFAVRLLSVAIGACLAYLIYVLMRRLFPQEAGVALTATAMAAFLPMHVAILSAITNDGLAELAATATLYACLGGIASGFTDHRAVIVGALLGLGALAKTGCLLFVPVALLAMALRMHQTRWHLARLLRQWGLCVVVCLAISGWWLVRNTQLYGDPLAMGAFREIFAATRPTPHWFFDRGFSFATYVGVVVVWTACSFWGVLGQANQFMPAWFYALGAALTLWAVAGCVCLWRRSRRGEAEMDVVQRQMLVLMAGALGLVLIACVKFNMEFFQAQARYLFPAIAPITCFFALGWRELVPTRLRPHVLVALTVCLFGMSVCALVPALASTSPPLPAM